MEGIANSGPTTLLRSNACACCGLCGCLPGQARLADHRVVPGSLVPGPLTPAHRSHRRPTADVASHRSPSAANASRPRPPRQRPRHGPNATPLSNQSPGRAGDACTAPFHSCASHAFGRRPQTWPATKRRSQQTRRDHVPRANVPGTAQTPLRYPTSPRAVPGTLAPRPFTPAHRTLSAGAHRLGRPPNAARGKRVAPTFPAPTSPARPKRHSAIQPVPGPCRGRLHRALSLLRIARFRPAPTDLAGHQTPLAASASRPRSPRQRPRHGPNATPLSNQSPGRAGDACNSRIARSRRPQTWPATNRRVQQTRRDVPRANVPGTAQTPLRYPTSPRAVPGTLAPRPFTPAHRTLSAGAHRLGRPPNAARGKRVAPTFPAPTSPARPKRHSAIQPITGPCRGRLHRALSPPRIARFRPAPTDLAGHQSPCAASASRPRSPRQRPRHGPNATPLSNQSPGRAGDACTAPSHPCASHAFGRRPQTGRPPNAARGKRVAPTFPAPTSPARPKRYSAIQPVPGPCRGRLHRALSLLRIARFRPAPTDLAGHQTPLAASASRPRSPRQRPRHGPNATPLSSQSPGRAGDACTAPFHPRASHAPAADRRRGQPPLSVRSKRVATTSPAPTSPARPKRHSAIQPVPGPCRGRLHRALSLLRIARFRPAPTDLAGHQTPLAASASRPRSPHQRPRHGPNATPLSSQSPGRAGDARTAPSHPCVSHAFGSATAA